MKSLSEENVKLHLEVVKLQNANAVLNQRIGVYREIIARLEKELAECRKGK